VFSIQLITGILLMTSYSPSASQAWSSVHYIQYQMDFGWLVRGLHHFGSQTMMVLIALHMLQVVLGGAHLPPREWNWWTGIGLLSVTLGLSLTGYLLPWDQKGFWATDVATNISGTLPEIGPFVKQQAVGGPDSGNHTLTRFFALHAGILPALLIALLIVHLVFFRRHGVTSPENQEGFVTKPGNEHAPNTEPFWPRQFFYDLVACMFVFAVMVGLLFLPHQDEEGHWHYGHGNAVKEGEEAKDWLEYNYWAHAGQRGVGANLDAPADRETANYPARPEWYFLPLFQLLKYFKGDNSIYGTVIIPNGVMLLLTLLPLFGYGPMRIVGRIFGILVMVALLGGILVLIVLALRDDEPGGVFVPHYYAAGLLLLPVIAYFVVRPLYRGLAGPAAAVTFLACAAGLMASLYGGQFQDELWLHVVHTEAKALGRAKSFQDDVTLAEGPAKRSVQMAMTGTPVDGGAWMLRNDPLTAGQRLFQQKCGSCHNFTAQKGDPLENWKGGKSASDLGDFGTEAWIRSLLNDSMTDKHFGLVKTVELDEKGNRMKDDKGKDIVIPGLTGMRGWHKGIMKARERKNNPVNAEQQEKEFDTIAKWLANQALPKEKRTDDQLIMAGQAAFESDTNKCVSCHRAEFKREDPDTKKFKWVKEGDVTAPDLSNYGSAEWIRAMIMSPGHKDRYGDRNLMPTFRNMDGPGSELILQEFRESSPNTKEHQIQNLTDIERELIVRFMQRDYRAIYGGSPIR
jgi:quinol-cytochrome oxidoreductase complex cytochrome b subunit/mono/diheme cytochrome c family protein